MTYDLTIPAQRVQQIIDSLGFKVVDTDLTRPWGGFIRLANEDAEKFIAQYFPDRTFSTYENLSPKFLIFAPGKRLSWQKHDRRAEIWRVLEGVVGVKTASTDEEPDDVIIIQKGEYIEFGLNVRHRGGGIDGWAIVTEIWQHADGDNPSDEADIVRISDDFGR